MISAGNDIVSLAAIDVTRTNQHKFYSKILSHAEIPLYSEFSLAQIPFENFVWLLWSIKESAYKFLQRNTPALVFTPVKFVVTDVVVPGGFLPQAFSSPMLEGVGFRNIPHIKSIVKFAEQELHSCSLVYNEVIHTVLNQDIDFENVYWGVRKINSDDNSLQSTEVRSFLVDRLTGRYSDDGFIIDKNPDGCPVLLRSGAAIDVPISLSHHGCFVGYSFYKSGH
ncbi:MAG: 4'-phosphopantetheinyl transferase superfamily protein [Bacteroidota bacterium]